MNSTKYSHQTRQYSELHIDHFDCSSPYIGTVCCKSIAHGQWTPGLYSLRDTGPVTQLRVTPRLRRMTRISVAGPVSLKLYGPGAQWPCAVFLQQTVCAACASRSRGTDTRRGVQQTVCAACASRPCGTDTRRGVQQTVCAACASRPCGTDTRRGVQQTVCAACASRSRGTDTRRGGRRTASSGCCSRPATGQV